MLETLKQLCERNGVSGCEDQVREYIKSRVSVHVDKIMTDVMGNLIVFKKGRKATDKKIMLCAHMDEVGVIITDITEDGYIKFESVGGIDRRVIVGKSVCFGDVYGVVGMKPIHLVKSDERRKIPKFDDLYIDIGAKNREEAEKLVALGDTGAFYSDCQEFGDGFFKGKAIDDRLGCAVMIKLIESELPVDCYFVFTTQEEVGCRGAFGASFRIAPDIALILETTTAADLPGVDESKRICSPGKGVVIPFMDKGTIYDRGLYALLKALAEQNDIPWQTKRYIAGGTDASSVQRSRSGVRVAGMACAIRNIHSHNCVGSTADFFNMEKLAKLFLEKMGESANEL